MESSESEKIFDSLNLNPQLFINEVLNSVDDLVDEAFEFFHQQASTVVKIDGTDKSQELREGVAYLRNLVQSTLDKRLSMWEKYCLRHCFVVPQGFVLPKDEESADKSLATLDSHHSEALDLELVSLRDKLEMVRKETTDLNSELEELERQTTSNNRLAEYLKEVLDEQHSADEIYKELVKMGSKLRDEVKRLKRRRMEEAERSHVEKILAANGNVNGTKHGGVLDAEVEDLESFLSGLKTR